MSGNNISGWCNEKGYRIRSMRSLLCQIKEDYAICDRLWNRLGKGAIGMYQAMELVRALCWTRQGLNAFEELKRMGIEGISCGEIKDIEKDVIEKETGLKQVLFSVSFETKKMSPSATPGDLRPPGFK